MEARITPSPEIVTDVTHVPGLQPFATLTLRELTPCNSQIVVEVWNPNVLLVLGQRATRLARELAAELAKPRLEEPAGNQPWDSMTDQEIVDWFRHTDERDEP